MPVLRANINIFKFYFYKYHLKQLFYFYKKKKYREYFLQNFEPYSEWGNAMKVSLIFCCN